MLKYYTLCAAVMATVKTKQMVMCQHEYQLFFGGSAWTYPSSDRGPAARGRLLVRPQVADPGEPLPTLVTAEGFLPGVNSLVLLQVPSLREAFPAGVAAEGFLSRVDSLVGLQIGQARESLATDPAHVAPPAALAGQDAGSLVFTVAGEQPGSMLRGDGGVDA